MGPLPTVHVMLVVVAEVTEHATPDMVTVLSEVTLLKPEPLTTIDVPKAEVPENKQYNYTYLYVCSFVFFYGIDHFN